MWQKFLYLLKTVHLFLLLQLEKISNKASKTILDKYYPGNIFSSLDKIVSTSIWSLTDMFQAMMDTTHSRGDCVRMAHKKFKPIECRNFIQPLCEDSRTRDIWLKDSPDGLDLPSLQISVLFPMGKFLSSLVSAQLSSENLISNPNC